MSDLSNVNLDPNVPEAGSFQVVPEGRYKAVIAGDKLYPTKDTKGRILELTVQIIEGQFSGLTIPDRLNILNPSEIAQRIAQGTLKRICSAVGVAYPLQNTDVLLGKPMLVTVEIEKFKSNKTGNDLQSNKIKNYAPWVAQTPQAAAPPVKTSW
jgi:hypothetical protein